MPENTPGAPKRLFLLDAYALIFRAYYALIKMPRITQTGFNTSAIFGFVNTLEEVLRKERPSHIAVCFDPHGPTFRSEAFEKYKGERDPMPEDIRLSVPYIKQIIEAYRIPLLEHDGFEADDVIGTMARRAEAEGFTTYMMTPDKDFGQLVSPSILQYKPSYRGQDFELRGEEEVCARYGIERTSQVIDLLALMGDKIDNIPGCPGVGEKTAVKLIHEFGSVENLLDNVGSVKGAMGRKVADHAEDIRFSKFLATIRTDVPLEENPEALERRPADRARLFALFRELEFKALADRVARRLDADDFEEPAPGDGIRNGERTVSASSSRSQAAPGSLFSDDDFEEGSPADAVVGSGPFAEGACPAQPLDLPESKWRVADSAEELREMNDALLEADSVGVCMATVGEQDMEARWFGTALCLEDGRGWYVPDSFEDGRAAVLDVLARPDIRKVSASAKRDMVVAARRRTDDAPALRNYYDVALAHYLLQPDMRHGLAELASSCLGISLPWDAPFDPPKGKKAFEEPPREATMRRACTLAWIGLKLEPVLRGALDEEGLSKLMDEVELPLVPVLASMEQTGVRLDTEALRTAAVEMEAAMDKLQRRIWEMAGEEFNVGSPSKVGEILFGKMGLDPKAKKTKTGQYSTSEAVLEKFAADNPIVGLILEYRQMKKLLNTYLTVLPESINPLTGHIHTNYNQTVTATGRISSSSPNLQNIPVRDEMGREIRRAFIADPGHLFLSADYSQIELRLVADFADEEVMADAFIHDKDIHAITAAKIYHKEVPEVTADERRNAKTANFGILYGISPFGLSSRLGIPRAEAKELIDNYFRTFPKIHKYMSDSVENARENLYAITRMGRKRRLPDINSRNPVVRGVAERNAINAPVQGTAADIIKVAMINIDRELRERRLKSKMTMQVHDELNFDVLPEELEEVKEIVGRCMEGVWKGRVVLTASIGVGDNWLDAH